MRVRARVYMYVFILSFSTKVISTNQCIANIYIIVRLGVSVQLFQMNNSEDIQLNNVALKMPDDDD